MVVNKEITWLIAKE